MCKQWRRRIRRAVLPVLAFLFTLTAAGDCRRTYAASAYEILLSLFAETDTSRTLAPREEVPFGLYVGNLGGQSWLRVRVETLAQGVDREFSHAYLSECEGWIRRGEYYYYTAKAPEGAVIQVLESFRVPDFQSADGGVLTIRAQAEGIDLRSVYPNFDLDDPWKGKNPDNVVNLVVEGGSSGGGGGGSGNGSGSSSGRTGGLVRYTSPQSNASVSAGKWYLMDAENQLWKYGQAETKSYAADGWYFLPNEYSRQKDKNQWFYFDKDGYMSVGWINPSGFDWYHLHAVSDGELGSLDRGLYTDAQDGRSYFLDETIGLMLTGWQDTSGGRRYFAPVTEIPAANWIYKSIGNTTVGRWFYNAVGLRSYGSMYVNERTPDGSLVDSAGVLVEKGAL